MLRGSKTKASWGEDQSRLGQKMAAVNSRQLGRMMKRDRSMGSGWFKCSQTIG